MSATQEVSRDFGVPVAAIATLADITATLRGRQNERAHLERIEDYRGKYGVATG
jgi:orotate phosphoribosyltransferase